jgi:hypothetical protein
MQHNPNDEVKGAFSSEQILFENKDLSWADTPEITARLEKHLAKNQVPTESDLDAFEARILEQP